MSGEAGTGHRTRTGTAVALVAAVLLACVGGVGFAVTRSAADDTTGTAAADAALQAGVDAVLVRVRSAIGAQSGTSGTTPAVALGLLPCTVSGSVGEGTARRSYVVSVAYSDADPTGGDHVQLAAHAVPCLPAGVGVAQVPQFATVSARVAGSGGAPGRVREALYALRFGPSTVVVGGRFFTVDRTACLQADAAREGSPVRYAAVADCTGTDLQRWTYEPGASVRLAATPDGAALCLTNPDADLGGPVVLARCAPGRATQKWSYEGGARFRGQDADNSDYGTTCLWAGRTSGPRAGDPLQAGPRGCTSSDEDWGSFSPEPSVGAGGASKATDQLVDHLQFGRCADVTDQDVERPWTIVYPCKQDPSTGGGKLAWNQRWYYTAGTAQDPVTAPQAITVRVDDDPARTSCLTVPAPAPGPARAAFRPCSADEPGQRFVRSELLATDYAASSTLTDAWGRCLGLGAPADERQWASVVVATCTGGPDQKWNAPAGLQDPVLLLRADPARTA